MGMIRAAGAMLTPVKVQVLERVVISLSPLPRPVLAGLGALAIAYALWDPEGFEAQLLALAALPEPLWWLLGGGLALGIGAKGVYVHSAGLVGKQRLSPEASGASQDPPLSEDVDKAEASRHT